MNGETMQAGTRVCFLADGEYCGGQWTGLYGTCGEYEILCDYCSRVHWINPEDFLPIPNFEPTDFNEQEYRVRESFAVTRSKQGRYAVLGFPLIMAGLCACVVGGMSIFHGNYWIGGLGFLLFVGAFVLADRLERG